MNKTQAETILNGYIRIFGNPNMDDVANVLREIIIDAMISNDKTSRYVNTYPNITVPTNIGTWDPVKPSTTYTTIHNGSGL